MYAKNVAEKKGTGHEEKMTSLVLDPQCSLADAKAIQVGKEVFSVSSSGKHSDISTVDGGSFYRTFPSVDSLDRLEEKSEDSDASLTGDEEEQLDRILQRIASKQSLMDCTNKKELKCSRRKIHSKNGEFQEKAQTFVAMYEKVQQLALEESTQRDSDLSSMAKGSSDNHQEEKSKGYFEDKLLRLQKKHCGDADFKEQVEQEFHKLYTSLHPYCVSSDSVSFKAVAISQEAIDEPLSSESDSNKTISSVAQEYFEKYLESEQCNFQSLYFTGRI